MTQFYSFVVFLTMISMTLSAPLQKPKQQSKSSTVTSNKDKHNSKEIRSELKNSVTSIADFLVSVNGSNLILRKETPDMTIIISTKIPAIAQKIQVDPEYEVCDEERYFNVEFKRGSESLFTFLCLTPKFFDEKATFAVDRLEPNQPLTRTSFNDLSSIFSRASFLNDDRIRQILKDKEITPDLVEIMQSVADRYH